VQSGELNTLAITENMSTNKLKGQRGLSLCIAASDRPLLSGDLTRRVNRQLLAEAV
jgi:hypothetical protein